MKWLKNKNFLFYSLISAICGAVTLIGMSAFQKFMIGAPLFNVKGYLIPFIFGSATGFIIGIYYAKIIKANKDLVGKNRILVTEIEAKNRMESEQKKLLMAVEESPVMVVIADKEGMIEYINPKVTEITGYDPEDLVGKNPCVLNKCGLNNSDYDNIWKTVRSGAEYKGEVQNMRKNGEIYWEAVTIAPLRTKGEFKNYIIIKEDITDRKNSQEAIRFRAYHDLLTGVKNRLSLMEKLKSMDSGLSSEVVVSMFFINIDNFKDINDSMGHEIGDKVLQIMAKRLMHLIADNERVFRWGGDEFALLYHSSNLESVETFAAQLQDKLCQPVSIDAYEIFITTSLGIATTRDTQKCTGLIKNAALALNSIKKRGKHSFCFYHDSLRENIARRVEVENLLHYAIDNKELILFYQPKLNAVTGKMQGCEALIRWENPRLGFMNPGEFIPIAESSGMIINIGQWVIAEACRNFVQMRNEGYDLGRIAVNISSLHFKKEDFADKFIDVIKDNELPFDNFEVEITETALLENLDAVKKNLVKLSGTGVKISIDDFGTGYSSLAYLSKLPIDCIKIDRSFVTNINEDQNNASIVAAIMSIAKSLDLEVVAEGVETEEQAEFLRSVDCDIFQGFLYSRPLPMNELKAVIKKYE